MIAAGTNVLSPSGRIHVSSPPAPRRCATFAPLRSTACGCVLDGQWREADGAVDFPACLWVMRAALRRLDSDAG